MSILSSVATEVLRTISKNSVDNVKIASEERGAEYQRVNSYIADVLKDTHVLYAKLARLQGDFRGKELDELVTISEDVLEIGNSLSKFSRAFYEGEYESVKSEFVYGDQPQVQSQQAQPAPQQNKPPQQNQPPMSFGESEDEDEDELPVTQDEDYSDEEDQDQQE